jgi:hypothetical protein
MSLALVRSVRSAASRIVQGVLMSGVLVAFVVIPRLAGATLPDPAWISGLHGGVDHEEVCGAKVIRRSADISPAVPLVVPLASPGVASTGSLCAPLSLTLATGLGFRTRAPPWVTAPSPAIPRSASSASASAP